MADAMASCPEDFVKDGLDPDVESVEKERVELMQEVENRLDVAEALLLWE